MKKILLSVILLVSVFVFCACESTSLKTLNKVTSTIDKVESCVVNIDKISNDDLLIDSIMDDNSNDNNNTGYDGATFTSGSIVMDGFINSILKLSNQAHNAIDLNNDTNDILTQISNNIYDIKQLGKLIDKSNHSLDDDTLNSINDICNNILMNTNRLMITKDEVTNELSSTLALKRNYTNNVEQLTTKYIRLCSALQNKNAYLENVDNSLDNLYETLYISYRPNQKTTNSVNSFSNIDTYENAGKKTKNTIKQNSNKYPYNSNGNYGGAGYGMSNPYYNYGGFMGGRNYGGYGYGGYPYSPYGRYNPYMPNIDTFGTYKNIDTYKSLDELQEDAKDEDEDEEQYENEDILLRQPKIRRLKQK